MNLFCIYSVRLSRVRLFVTPWTVTRQAPLSMEFSRQEYWSRWPFPSSRDPPNPGIKPIPPALEMDSTTELPGKPVFIYMVLILIDSISV